MTVPLVLMSPSTVIIPEPFPIPPTQIVVPPIRSVFMIAIAAECQNLPCINQQCTRRFGSLSNLLAVNYRSNDHILIFIVNTTGKKNLTRRNSQAGNIFFLARSPDAPTTVILTVDSCSPRLRYVASLSASYDGIDKSLILAFLSRF